jgi:hypothetical protein
MKRILAALAALLLLSWCQQAHSQPVPGVQQYSCLSHTWANALGATGVTTCAQPNYTDLAGTNPATVTWPASSSLILSNSTNSPGGLAPVNGDCVVGAGGAWTAGACASGSGITQLTGDVTAGPGSGSQAATLATVNSNVGTFQGITVNGKGLVTAASNQGYLTGNQTITLSGDTTGSGTTAITTTTAKVNGVSYGSSPSTNTVPVITGSNTATYEALPLGAVATQSANTVVGNGTGSSAAPTALAMPSCSASTSALTWTTSTGFGCNTISAGTGTVTSVGLSDSSTTPIYSISGSPVTTSGTLTFTLATEAKNLVFAGPSNGSNAQPTFRALVGADLPNPSATTLGGIESLASASHKWINTISTSGVPSATQPACGDLSDSGNGCSGTLPVGANPSATAGPAAVNGSATTFMRSDAAPAVQKATSGQFGIVEGDGATLGLSSGVISINLSNANTWGAAQTFTNSDIKLLGSSTGATTFTSANSGSSNFTLTFPAATDTLVDLAGTQTLTNKTMSGASNTFSSIALSSLATQTANTVVGNATGSSASPTALAMPSCSSSNNALIWTTSTGFGCNTISSSGSPGGSNTDVQYNNSSAFGGNSGFTYDGTSVITLGTAGTSVGKVAFANATSGTITLQPPTGALGSAVITVPDVTDTIAVLGTKQSWTAAQRGTPTNISISTSTFTPNFDTAQNFEIDLVHASCPCTLANPSTTLVAGQSGMIEIHQSATGSDTIGTWGSDYQYVGGTSTITLSTAANAVDYLSYYVNNAATGIVLGALEKAPAH